MCSTIPLDYIVLEIMLKETTDNNCKDERHGIAPTEASASRSSTHLKAGPRKLRCFCYMGVIWGLYVDNGRENENYYIIMGYILGYILGL